MKHLQRRRQKEKQPLWKEEGVKISGLRRRMKKEVGRLIEGNKMTVTEEEAE